MIVVKTRINMSKYEPFRKYVKNNNKDGTTVSFTVTIPYTLHVDGEDYSSEYILGDWNSSSDDGNPKYYFEITNLTGNYETEVLITRK